MKINQLQNRTLLKEHAYSSFNFTFIGRNELYIAISFLLIGIIISVFTDHSRLGGIPFIFIGLLEIIKYPSREKRWVNKKEKEAIFNKEIEFEISDNSLLIKYDKESKSHKFVDMRECLISGTGVLFKVSHSEYYYISYKSMAGDKQKKELISNLHNRFPSKKIKTRKTHN